MRHIQDLRTTNTFMAIISKDFGGIAIAYNFVNMQFIKRFKLIGRAITQLLSK